MRLSHWFDTVLNQTAPWEKVLNFQWKYDAKYDVMCIYNILLDRVWEERGLTMDWTLPPAMATIYVEYFKENDFRNDIRNADCMADIRR